MAMAIERLRRFTEEEYLTIERQADYKSEYLDGLIFAMAGGTLEHSRISSNINRELGNRLKGSECQAFTSDMRIKVEKTGLNTYTDVSVICGEPRLASDARDVLLNPILLVEVLSESTEKYDRGAKFEHYRTIESLREYVLVSQNEPQIERRLRLTDGSWRTDVVEGLGASVHLESVGRDLPFAEVYDQVEFA